MITLTEHKDPCKTVNLDVDGYVIPNVRRSVAEYIAGLEAENGRNMKKYWIDRIVAYLCRKDLLHG